MMPSTGSQRWTPRAVLQRAPQVLREDGVVALFFKVLGETIYRRAILIDRSLDEQIPDVRTSVPLVIGWLDETQAEEYIRLRPIVAIDACEVLRRLRNGQQCLTARCDGRLVFVSWTTTRRAWVDYLQREIQLDPDEIFFYETFTAPASRDQNIASMALAFQLRFFRASGYHHLLGIVVPENYRALYLTRKVGYHTRGILGYMRLGQWRRDFFHPIARPSVNTANWSGDFVQLRGNRHYLDPFLATLKKDAHVRLIERWGGVPRSGLTLKTDLFEEANGGDAFWHSVAGIDRAVGMDLSPAITFRAQAREPHAVYLVADVRALPFALHSFAFIVSPSTLDHFHDPQDLTRSLRELARVLAPGGRLIITLDNRQNLSDPLLRLANWLGWLPYYVGRSLTIRELRAELEALGFEVSDTAAILHNPRLFAVGLKLIANRIGWSPLTAGIERALVVAQKLGDTRLRYYTGSFIAAHASKSRNPNAETE